MSQRPSSREDFEVAIICALPLEYDAVVLLFDEFWDEDGDTFGRAIGDVNNYRTGRIGKHNVVLALLSHMGKAHAAAAAASMRSSYGALRLVILAGICGGVPFNSQGEIFLGDVVISKSIIQYDFGRKYPNGFMRKTTDEDNLRKHGKNIRNFLTKFDTSSDKVCDGALSSSCDNLGCDEDYLVVRKQLKEQDEAQEPAIYIGAVASGDTVMKSGEDRDSIARRESVIAFEMEGAGVWEEMPCIVIKGVGDGSICIEGNS
ncbi:5'-methylthioadenosine/S-adenosylhomocysteine nucleosidase [Trichoderma asperellum]|uniref:5'-methylthioadenosine/S-adenosylhomocysteine nucleosidase n=1 Tax=Trichoderma asperellum TaxID=101201 RepID=A0A6V8QX21_TRIAP|nr:5'-methylthioadenosine/S-adenosylhomocysteine nucleosidase [Trichoderma asperellum]